MNEIFVSVLKSIVAATGSVLAGPAGAALGGVLGGFVGSVLPEASSLVQEVFAKITSEKITAVASSTVDKLTPDEKEYLNHDLQTAFRDALTQALYDIGGSECFPAAWKGTGRDVPETVIFPECHMGKKLWMDRSPLASQICDCLHALEKGIAEDTILPLNPPTNLPAASAEKILLARNPQELSDTFFDQCISPALQPFQLLFREVPDFQPHLRHTIFDRTLIHLGELLKARAPAWRAFNRIILETLQDQVSQVQTGQQEILSRLDALLEQPQGEALTGWSTAMAELLAASGRVEKQFNESFDALSSRVISQHGEILARFDQLMLATGRIERKVDRVLRFLEDGRYTIEGESTVPLHKSPAPGKPPFKGLEYFSEEDAGLFFGREKLIAALVNRIYASHFLAIIGASGSGKSSVIRAGVIPLLKGNKVMEEMPLLPPNCQKWPVVVITPTAHPLESLSTALAHTTTQARDLAKSLTSDPHILDLAARKLASSAQSNRLLLVVDQFEEVFTQCQDSAEAQAFIDALMDAAGPDTPGIVTLIVILRADFYAQCAQYASLRQAISANQEFIGPMNQAELRLAIVEPAERSGWKFEPGLVDMMMRDAGNEPGSLPLLSHALLETWRHRSGHTMTLESYAESGGVREAIARTAEQVYRSQLTVEQQPVARSIFLRLTSLGDTNQDTRRRAELGELILHPEDKPLVEGVLRALVDARLVTTSEGTVEVAHEALIDHWPTLRQWLDENRQGLRVHRRLTDAAAEWQRSGRDDGLLFRGARLAETVEYAEANPQALNQLETQFLQSSRSLVNREAIEKEAQRQRELEAARRLAESESQRAEIQARSASRLKQRAFLLIGALAIAAVLAALAVVFAFQSANNANTASANALKADKNALQAQQNASTAEASGAEALRQSKIAQARELAARSSAVLPRDVDLSIWLALQAAQANPDPSSPLPEVQTSLFQALQPAPFSQVLAIPECPYNYCIRSAVFSPDGQHILTTGMTQGNLNTLVTNADSPSTSRYDSPAVLWDMQGNLVKELVLPANRSAFAITARFSPDGKDVAVGYSDGSIGVWSSTGGLLASTKAHSSAVLWVGFSPDGSLLLSTGQDNVARLWKAPLTPFQTLTGHTGPVSIAAFSTDGLLIATGSFDDSIRLWSVDGKPKGELAGHKAWVNDLSFSPDGKKILSASWDASVILWDISTAKPLATLLHPRSVYTAVFSPDGAQILTSCRDGFTRLWKMDGSLAMVLAGHSGPVNDAEFSPDGKLIVTVSDDSTVRIWGRDGTALRTLRGHNSFVYTAVFSSDGKSLVTAASDQRTWQGDYYYAGTARVWDVSRIASPALLDFKAAVSYAEFSPDNRQILIASSNGFHLWSLTGGLFHSPDQSAYSIVTATFNQDGSQFVTSGLPFASYAGVDIYQTSDGKLVSELKGHTGLVESASYSPDGQMVMTSSYDGSIRLWKTDGTLIRSIQVVPGGQSGPSGAVTRFSPDGKLIAAGDNQGKVSIFQTSDGSLVRSFPSGTVVLGSIDFSPDGQLILTGSYDNVARIHHLDGTLIAELKGHDQLINGARFSPDGKLIATASEDGTARIWSWDGKVVLPLVTLEGHAGAVVSAVFSPDQKHLVTSSWDGTIRTWDIYADWSALTTEAANRLKNYSPSRSECQRYLHTEQCP